jgi:hypothetical protein
VHAGNNDDDGTRNDLIVVSSLFPLHHSGKTDPVNLLISFWRYRALDLLIVPQCRLELPSILR